MSVKNVLSLSFSGLSSPAAPTPRAAFFIGTSMDTLTLDAELWDIGLDEAGNLSVSSDTYRILQDACAAAQTWLGEVYYDQSLGVSYDDALLSGQTPSAFYASDVESAVQAVPGVAAVTCHLLAPSAERTLKGILVITTTNGQTAYVAY